MMTSPMPFVASLCPDRIIGLHVVSQSIEFPGAATLGIGEYLEYLFSRFSWPICLLANNCRR